MEIGYASSNINRTFIHHAAKPKLFKRNHLWEFIFLKLSFPNENLHALIREPFDIYPAS